MQQSSSVNKEKILDQLRQVRIGEGGKDVVSAGLVSGITVHGERVGFLLEGDASQEELRQQCVTSVESLAGVSQVTAVLTAHQNTPQTPSESARKQAVWNREPIAGVKKVIAVASGKGGVGKSSIATLLALALAKQGKSVGLLDADIYGPSIPTMLGLSGQAEVEEGKLVPEAAHGVKCMSMGLIVGDQATVMRAPRVTKALVQMLRGTIWSSPGSSTDRVLVPSEGTQGEDSMSERAFSASDQRAASCESKEAFTEATLDLLIVDMPPGTGDVHLSMVQNTPLAGAIVITLASKVAALDAKKSIEMFEKVDVPVLGIIENMSSMVGGAAPFGSGGGEQLAEETGYPLLAKLPLEAEIGELLNEGRNPFEEVGESEFLDKIDNLSIF